MAAGVGGARRVDDGSEKECAVDLDGTGVNGIAEEREGPTSRNNPKGMSPFDPKFLAMARGFLLIVNLSS